MFNCQRPSSRPAASASASASASSASSSSAAAASGPASVGAADRTDVKGADGSRSGRVVDREQHLKSLPDGWSVFPRMLRTVPSTARQAMCEAAAVPLKAFAQAFKRNDRAAGTQFLEDFLSLPRTFLLRPKRGGSKASKSNALALNRRLRAHLIAADVSAAVSRVSDGKDVKDAKDAKDGLMGPNSCLDSKHSTPAALDGAAAESGVDRPSAIAMAAAAAEVKDGGGGSNSQEISAPHSPSPSVAAPPAVDPPTDLPPAALVRPVRRDVGAREMERMRSVSDYMEKISPELTEAERRAKNSAERTIRDGQRHAIHHACRRLVNQFNSIYYRIETNKSKSDIVFLFDRQR